MRDLPRDIDADVVIEASRLLDDAEDLAPLPVHELDKRIRTTLQTRLSDQVIEELVVEMASKRGLPMVLDKPAGYSILPYLLRKHRQKQAAKRCCPSSGSAFRLPGLAKISHRLDSTDLGSQFIGEMATRYYTILAARSPNQRRASSPQFTRLSRARKRPDQRSGQV